MERPFFFVVPSMLHNGGPGRDSKIFYSEVDYLVSDEKYKRKLYSG